jgi:hypothetical protein
VSCAARRVVALRDPPPRPRGGAPRPRPRKSSSSVRALRSLRAQVAPVETVPRGPMGDHDACTRSSPSCRISGSSSPRSGGCRATRPTRSPALSRAGRRPAAWCGRGRRRAGSEVRDAPSAPVQRKGRTRSVPPEGSSGPQASSAGGPGPSCHEPASASRRVSSGQSAREVYEPVVPRGDDLHVVRCPGMRARLLTTARNVDAPLPSSRALRARKWRSSCRRRPGCASPRATLRAPPSSRALERMDSDHVPWVELAVLRAVACHECGDAGEAGAGAGARAVGAHRASMAARRDRQADGGAAPGPHTRSPQVRRGEAHRRVRRTATRRAIPSRRSLEPLSDREQDLPLPHERSRPGRSPASRS